MAKTKKKPEAEPVVGFDLANGNDETVVVWRAVRPLTNIQHEQLRAKLEREQTATGIKIMLVPFSVEAVMADGKE
jgi:hypothetical protein